MDMSDGENHAQQPKKRMRKFTYIALVVVPIGIVIAGAVAAYQSHQADKTAASETQSRVAADPPTINGILKALNTKRTEAGVASLNTVPNLAVAAQQYCDDMVNGNYAAVKNPKTGKDANSFIKDNEGELFFKNYVANWLSMVPTRQTAGDVVNEAQKYNAASLNNADYNSVGVAVCKSPKSSNTEYVTIMLANKTER